MAGSRARRSEPWSFRGSLREDSHSRPRAPAQRYEVHRLGTGSGVSYGIGQDDVVVTPGQTYTFSVWLKKANTSYADVWLEVDDAHTGATIASTSYTGLSTSFQQFTLSFTVPSGTSQILPMAFYYAAAGGDTRRRLPDGRHRRHNHDQPRDCGGCGRRRGGHSERLDGRHVGQSDDLSDEAYPRNQRIGLRFTNMTIPPRQDDHAGVCTVHGQRPYPGVEPPNLTIKGFAQDNTAAFTTATSNISSRPVTTAAVTGWNPPLWSTVGAAGPDQQTPELKTVIQQIVNRAGWASGDALGLVVSSPTNGVNREAETYEAGAGQAVLHVEYQ